jgi:ribosomal protein L37AE/L43A
MQGAQYPELSPRTAPSQADTGYSVEKFNPLLRSLLTWDLVERVETDDGTHRWELTDAAQRQLDQLTPPRQRAVTALAYLDHCCANCRQQHLTHLRDGRYLCEECERLEAVGPAQEPARAGAWAVGESIRKTWSPARRRVFGAQRAASG